MANVIEKPLETEEIQAEKAEVLTPKDGIEDLKLRLAEADANLAAEKARAVEAERRANAATVSAHKATVDAEDTNLKLVENAIEVSKNNAIGFRSALAEAYKAQDFEKVAEIQEKMAATQARLLQLEAGAANMRARPKVEPPKPIITDPVEALASQVTPRSAAWIRAHPDYARDQGKMQQMVAAHNLAVARGALVDSDGYFSEVERILGIDQRRHEQTQTIDLDDDQPPPTPARRATPAAVPAGRGGSSGNSGSNGASARSTRLTEAEREMARMCKLTDEEYAQQKMNIKREGLN